MSAHIVKLGTPEHQVVQDLLAWYVMDTLDADDRALVEDHLRGCAACQRDAQWNQRLRAAHDQALPVLDVEHAFDALRVRLDQSEKSARTLVSESGLPLKASVRRWRDQFTWTRLAIAAQFAVIAVLCGQVALNSASTSPTFHALSQANAAIASRLVVVFAPQTAEQEMRRVLRESGARIVDGPTATDAYILEVASDQVDHALKVLRTEHAIALVQALQARDSH